MDKEQSIQEQIEQVSKLKFGDHINTDMAFKGTELIIRRCFMSPDRSIYAAQMKAASDAFVNSYEPQFVPPGFRDARFENARSMLINLLQTMQKDLVMMKEGLPDNSSERTPTGTLSKRIFIVHGHDNEMKESVARILERLKLEPIILQEQPDRNRTVFQKFQDYSDVGFAVVLISPDDLGRAKESLPEGEKHRPRQNVVFELGYFIGKLGQKRVLVLCRKPEACEIFSDYSGILYTPYDDQGAWKTRLVRELRTVGYDVDANAIL